MKNHFERDNQFPRINQKDNNIIWNRLKRAQTQHHMSNK